MVVAKRKLNEDSIKNKKRNIRIDDSIFFFQFESWYLKSLKGYSIIVLYILIRREIKKISL